MGMAVVVAFVEEIGLFLLEEAEVKLDHQGRDEADEGGFERGGEAARDAEKGVFEARDFSPGLEGFAKIADGEAETLHCANKTKNRDGPDDAGDHGVAGGDLVFVVFGLAGEDRGNVGKAADIVEVGEGAFDAVEENEMARVIDEAVEAFEDGAGGGFVEDEIGLLRDGGEFEGAALEFEFAGFDVERGDRPKEEDERGTDGVDVSGADEDDRETMSGENVKESSRASTIAAAPCGLCAASSTTVGERRMISRRPGEMTSANASRTMSASSASSPPRNASTAASASAAFCAWCAP